MIKKIYTDRLKKHMLSILKPTTKVFLFGSCLDKGNSFADVDVGLLGKGFDDNKIALLKEGLENSTFPYKIDIVNFNDVDSSFVNEVFDKKIEWLT